MVVLPLLVALRVTRHVPLVALATSLVPDTAHGPVADQRAPAPEGTVSIRVRVVRLERFTDRTSPGTADVNNGVVVVGATVVAVVVDVVAAAAVVTRTGAALWAVPATPLAVTTTEYVVPGLRT